MLTDFAPTPTLAVADLERAKAFYEGVLGFAAGAEMADGVLYSAGPGGFLVYPSSFAGTNQATAMSFQIPAAGFDAEIARLRGQGVQFQTFEAPGLTWDEGVATLADVFRGVWFADPDGNILSVETLATSG